MELNSVGNLDGEGFGEWPRKISKPAARQPTNNFSPTIVTTPDSAMGKKRKAGGKPFGQPSTREIRPEDAKLTINSYEDVADSEDDFFIGRDKILLEEGPERKRLRRAEEEGRLCFALLDRKILMVLGRCFP